MNIRRLLTTPLGRSLISILLGIGLACLFQKACSDRSCIDFSGPVISDIHEKIYKQDEKCYKYKSVVTKCNDNKKIIDVSDPIPVD